MADTAAHLVTACFPYSHPAVPEPGGVMTETVVWHVVKTDTLGDYEFRVPHDLRGRVHACSTTLDANNDCATP